MRRRRELMPAKPLFPDNLRFYKREGNAVTGYATTVNPDGMDEAKAVLLVGSGRGLESWVEDKGRRIEQTITFNASASADKAETELQAKGFHKE
jgi:hypothetical protein